MSEEFNRRSNGRRPEDAIKIWASPVLLTICIALIGAMWKTQMDQQIVIERKLEQNREVIVRLTVKLDEKTKSDNARLEHIERRIEQHDQRLRSGGL